MKNAILFFLFFIFMKSVFGVELTLNDFLKKVMTQNLNLKLEVAKKNLAEEKSVGLRLPPPMLGITRNNEETSSNGLEISQEVPFPTKLKADYNARIIESKAQQAMLKASHSEIISKAKNDYINLWITQEKIEVINQKKRILEEHIRLSKSAVRSDSFLNIHLLKAESDLGLLENEIESTRQLLKEKKYIMADIINVDPQSFDIEALEPPMSPIPKLSDFESTPQIASLKLILEGLRAREVEAQASWLPDFNLKYKEMNATRMSNKYREIMVGITLPFIYFWEPKASSNVANIEKLQAEINLNKERRNIDTKFAILTSKVESLQMQLLNLKRKLIPWAEKRMKIIHNIAPRDMETIQDHRETMEAFPNLRLIELELRMQYEEAVSELEKYTIHKDPINE